MPVCLIVADTQKDQTVFPVLHREKSSNQGFDIFQPHKEPMLDGSAAPTSRPGKFRASCSLHTPHLLSHQVPIASAPPYLQNRTHFLIPPPPPLASTLQFLGFQCRWSSQTLLSTLLVRLLQCEDWAAESFQKTHQGSLYHRGQSANPPSWCQRPSNLAHLSCPPSPVFCKQCVICGPSYTLRLFLAVAPVVFSAHSFLPPFLAQLTQTPSTHSASVVHPVENLWLWTVDLAHAPVLLAGCVLLHHACRIC